jgi:flagellar basal body-associated protein FliL
VSDEDSSGDDDNDDDSHSLMTAIVVLLSIIVVVLLGLGGVAYRRYHKSENGDHVQEKADDNKVKLLDE